MPADAQLNACTTGAGAEDNAAGAGALDAGRGSSQAMHFAALRGLFVEQISHVHTSADGLGGGAIPAEAQLNDCTGAGADAVDDVALGGLDAGRGSSHAMHLDCSSGLLVPQVSQVQMSAEGFGGGASPADAQLNPPDEVDATG